MADPIWKVTAQFGGGFLSVTSTHSAPDEDAAIDLLKAAHPMNYGNADWVRAYEITRAEAMAMRAEQDPPQAHSPQDDTQAEHVSAQARSLEDE